MGTAAKESGFQFLEQLGRGPALGFYQIEPATYRDLWERYLFARPPLAAKARFWAARGAYGVYPDVDQVVWNLRYATVICRLIYYSRPFKMPFLLVPEQLAAIWKQFYNTRLGHGTEAEFSSTYVRLVQGRSAID